MHAILSDIHGNLEALTAVLADIARQGVARVVNLGDTVGYGPDPLACLDLAAAMDVTLCGNFDHATLFAPGHFCVNAEQSVLWTQAQLRAAADDRNGERRRAFLADLPQSWRDGDGLYVHGSPRHPQNEYVFPEDIHNEQKMTALGERFASLCFAGHTHIPGAFRELSPGRWEYLHAEELERGLPVGDDKLLINVGSVGQPRDGDPRACYALCDGGRVWLRQVEYDFEATIRKIYAVPELANFLGDRLREGR